MSSVSKKIRDTERLLRRVKDPDEIANLHLKLKDYKNQKENNAKNLKERVNSVKYHLVKFLERKKVTRKIRSLERRIGDYSSDEVLTPDELQHEHDSWMDKLTYIMYHPKDNKYIAILKDESPSSSSSKIATRVSDDRNKAAASANREKTWARAREARLRDSSEGRKDKVAHAMEVEYNNAKDFAVSETIEKDVDAAIIDDNDDNDNNNNENDSDNNNENDSDNNNENDIKDNSEIDDSDDAKDAPKVDKGYTPSPYDPVVYGGLPRITKSVVKSGSKLREITEKSNSNKGKNNKSRKPSLNDHRTRSASGTKISSADSADAVSTASLPTVKTDSFFSEEASVNGDDSTSTSRHIVRQKKPKSNSGGALRPRSKIEIDTKGMSKQELRLHQWQLKTRAKHFTINSSSTSGGGGRLKSKVNSLRSKEGSSGSSSNNNNKHAPTKNSTLRAAKPAIDGYDPNYNKSAWEMGKGISAQSASETVKRKNSGTIVNDKSVPKAKKIKFDE